MPRTCPRDATTLERYDDHAVEVDRCPTCAGEWLDGDELTKLERTAAPEDALIGTVEFGVVESELRCPDCGAEMKMFDYRANALQLDFCPQEHGFWLDGGESERVRELIRQRAQDLNRSAGAQRRWSADRGRGFKPPFADRLRNLFR